MGRTDVEKQRPPGSDVKSRPASQFKYRQSRHQRGAPALAACIVVGAFGCSTTHQLGYASLDATITSLKVAAGQPGAVVRIEPLPGGPQADGAIPVRSLALEGLVLDAPGEPVVPFQRVRSVSQFDRTRGARDGALIGAVSAFVLTAVVGGILIKRKFDTVLEDGGSFDHPVLLDLTLSAAGAAAGAFVGGVVGASVGHEERYVVARE